MFDEIGRQTHSHVTRCDLECLCVLAQNQGMKQFLSLPTCRSELVVGVQFSYRLNPPVDTANENAKNETESQVGMKTSDYHTAPGKEKAVEPPVPTPQPQPDLTLNPPMSVCPMPGKEGTTKPPVPTPQPQPDLTLNPPMSICPMPGKEGTTKPPVPTPQPQPDLTLNSPPMFTTPCPTPGTTQHVPPPTSIVAQPTPEENEKWPPDSAGGAGNGLAVGGNPSFDTERETMPTSLKTFLRNEETSHFGLPKDDNFPLRGTLDLPPLTPEFQRMNSGEKPFLHLPSPDKNMPLIFPLPLETTVGKLEFSLDSGCASMQIPE